MGSALLEPPARTLSAKTLGVLAVVGLVVAFSLSSTLVKRAETPGVLVAFWRLRCAGARVLLGFDSVGALDLWMPVRVIVVIGEPFARPRVNGRGRHRWAQRSASPRQARSAWRP